MSKTKTVFLMLLLVVFSQELNKDPVPVNVKEVIKYVVRLRVPKAIIMGTGFFINRNTIVTNAHSIIDDHKLIPVNEIIIDQIGYKKNTSIKVVEILDISLLHDLALLKVEGDYGAGLSLSNLPSSDNVYLIGFPITMLKVITGKNLKNRSTNYTFLANFTNLYGSSGGPVLNSNGEVIGICYRAQQNIVQAQKVTHLQNLILTPSKFKNFKNGNHFLQQEVNRIQDLANNEDVSAQLFLAFMYRDGFLIKQDYKKARQWLEAAAENGHSEIYTILGMINYHGHGMEKPNYKEAFKWFSKAAKQGDAIGQSQLGWAHWAGKNGTGKSNLKKAFKWIHKSAKQGYLRAYYELGLMYYYGVGMKKPNLKKAIKWLKQAALQGHTDSQIHLGNMYYQGKGLEKPNFKMAFNFFNQAAQQGENREAYFMVGWMFYIGHGVMKDHNKARKWLNIAAFFKHPEALELLDTLQ